MKVFLLALTSIILSVTAQFALKAGMTKIKATGQKAGRTAYRCCGPS